MQSLFDDYAALLECGIPKEDARYLLPYCFRSNFYCTMNARELLYMITVMCVGRGSYFPELKALGESLKEQIRAYFPKLPDLFEKRFPAGSDRYAPPAVPACPQPEAAQGRAELLHVSPVADALTVSAAFNFVSGSQPADPDAVLHGERTRELEMIWAQFALRDLSLAAVTHLVRHRMQTVLVPQVTQAVLTQHYVLPESIENNADAREIYTAAFMRNADVLNRMLPEGLPAAAVQYFALAGNQVDVLCAMNGRELLHFMKLRTCSRAQWEIRGVAVDLLRQLRLAEGSVFDRFGPSCFVTGKCPEGRLSCGKTAQMQEIFGGKL
jgi:thymidylate synthase (FAD)